MKLAIKDLAIFGGTPAFLSPIHVGRPNIGNRQRFHARMDDVLERKWLTNDGRYAKEFEQRVAELSGVKHAVAMCNGTAALEIAVRALGLRGEVILPSFTFVATAHALKWQEITPVFCDVDPRTHNIDPSKVEQLITARTTGILGVHLWGRACPVGALSEIAVRHRLKLLFDAAHALGCTHKHRMIGGFGDAEVFSFHATKFINSFEGGAVVTNDDELAHKLRLMKNFGFTDYDRTDRVGINAKMDEVAAAMGLTNLESIEEFVGANYRNYEQYRHELASTDGVSLLRYDEGEKNNFQYIVLEIEQNNTLVTRDQIVRILHAENILARRYFYPGCHRMEPYQSLFPQAGLFLPETESLCERVLCLPTGTSIGSDQVSGICEILRFVTAHGEEIRIRYDRGKPAQ